MGYVGIQHLLLGPVTSRSLVELNHSRMRGVGVDLNPRVMRVVANACCCDTVSLYQACSVSQ